MSYRVRPATIDDVPHIVFHREQMFRDMNTPCDYAAMSAAFERWLRQVMPLGTYRAWVVEAPDGEVVGGAGVIVFPWAPGPDRLDPRLPFVFNVYTAPAHRKRGLARLLMEAIHAWFRAEGIERAALNASVFGKPIYEAMGYTVVADPMMRIRL